MRVTIRKRKRHEKRQKNRKVCVFFIIIPLVTITIGWNLTKRVIVPYLNRDSIAAEQKLQNASALSQMNLYNIEVGKFKDIEDSELFLRKLNNENLFGYVSKLDDYVIYSCLTFNKKDVEDKLIKINESYPGAEINSITIESKKIVVEESEKNLLNKVIQTADLLNEKYRAEMGLWLEGVAALDYKMIEDKLTKNNKEINENIAQYSDVFLSDKVESQELKTLYLILSQNLETREQIVEEIDVENPEYIKKTYYDFVKSLFTYINYYNM